MLWGSKLSLEFYHLIILCLPLFLCSELWRSAKAQVINSFHSEVMNHIFKKQLFLWKKKPWFKC